MKKVYISKYALTRGVIEENCIPCGDMICWGSNYANNRNRPKEWAFTQGEANQQAELLRLRQIKRLEKQIEKFK